VDVSLTTLLIVAAAVMLLVKYWRDSHSTPVHQPASPALVPENSSEVLRLEYARLNRAYGCFGFLGVASLPFGIAALLDEFHLINFDAIVGVRLEGWTIFLGIPGMLCATIYGIRQTVRFRHPALVVLSVVSIICWGGTMIYMPYSDLHPTLDYVMGYVLGIAFGIYITANIFIPAWWFTMGRRRYRSKELAQE
jgi:hypothetical protein